MILDLTEVRRGDLPRVGGKGANLGELLAAGFPVPGGFCVTTEAYAAFVAGVPDWADTLAALARVAAADAEQVRSVAGRARERLVTTALPEPIVAGVRAALARHGDVPWAVRSSATAEDLPDASFAGQQDTYLQVRGEDAVIDAVRRCFASLFSDRAVAYRAQNGFPHEAVKLSVVVQRMVDPEVSGILFTADPVGGRRDVVSIDAGFGLGEALVSGLVSADLYRVEKASWKLLEARIGEKALAIRALPEGGTRHEALEGAARTERVLDDATVTALAQLGARVEAHYGSPQDVEWCVERGQLFLVQARPITSLYPLPDLGGRDGLRVLLSFGHVQMLLDPMSPLGCDTFARILPVARGEHGRSHGMVVAGHRLYLDLTPILRTAAGEHLLTAGSAIYPDAANTVRLLTARPDFARGSGSVLPLLWAGFSVLWPVGSRVAWLLWVKRRRVPEEAAEMLAFIQAKSAENDQRVAAAGDLRARLGAALDAVGRVFFDLVPVLPWLGSGVMGNAVLGRVAAGRWADPVRDALGELLRGLEGNVTTEMDLAVGDLADVLREHEALRAHLERDPADLKAARELPGGAVFGAALDAFLARYGARTAGEIDPMRPRWRERPDLVVRVALGGARVDQPHGAHRARHRAQVAAGKAAAERLVAAAGTGFWGWLRRPLVRRLTTVARAGLALREHPKLAIVHAVDRLRRVALEAGAELVARGQLDRADQAFLFDGVELDAALADRSLDRRALAADRAASMDRASRRMPPLVMASDGEIPILRLDLTDLPPGALAGTAASAGVVEGIARVIRDPDTEDLHAGEILVAPFTDPGWTPLFLHAAGLVTEVGGLMTHGSVVAREYGIPAVVSVRGATTQLRTGQRLRVDGTRGFVQILEEVP